jgi:hypothetical protein
MKDSAGDLEEEGGAARRGGDHQGGEDPRRGWPAAAEGPGANEDATARNRRAPDQHDAEGLCQGQAGKLERAKARHDGQDGKEENLSPGGIGERHRAILPGRT